MKLYRISQEYNCGYDTFDSAIVAAETEDAARLTHPNGGYTWGRFKQGRPSEPGNHEDQWGQPSKDGTWVDTDNRSWAPPSAVTAELIGEARDTIPAGVVLASFNAG